MRSGDDLKKLENLSSRRKVHMYVQSAYFQKTEVSVHVSVIHRHALLEYDGIDSLDDNPEIITEHFYVISPDQQHDQHFVHEVRKQIDYYLKSISYPVDTMHEFTDGCAALYKSRHCSET